MKGEMLFVFVPAFFLEIVRRFVASDRVGKKIVFSWDFLVFCVWRLWVLLLFCFEFAFLCAVFPQKKKKKLVFFADLVVFGVFFAISCGRIFVAARFPSTLALLPLLFLSSSSSLGLARVFLLLLLLIVPAGGRRRRIAPLRFALLASFCLSVCLGQPRLASSCLSSASSYFSSLLLPPFLSSFLAWSSI